MDPPAPPLPAEITLPGDLRSCLHPVIAPPDVPAIVAPAALRAAYEAERVARQKDQAAAVDCGKRLATVIELTDAFNVVHAAR